jgi:hypothetical protein
VSSVCRLREALHNKLLRAPLQPKKSSCTVESGIQNTTACHGIFTIRKRIVIIVCTQKRRAISLSPNAHTIAPWQTHLEIYINPREVKPQSSIPSILQSASPHKNHLLPIGVLLILDLLLLILDLLLPLLLLRASRCPTSRPTNKIVARVAIGLGFFVLGSACGCICGFELRGGVDCCWCWLRLGEYGGG